MIKVGEVERDSDLYYVYKIEDDMYYCIVQQKWDFEISKRRYESESMLNGTLIRKKVPDNKLSRKVYPNAISDNGELFVHPEGMKRDIEDFVERCKEFIDEEGL